MQAPPLTGINRVPHDIAPARSNRNPAQPELLRVGVRVASLGRSSVTYEVGVFFGAALAAHGAFTHVFVDASGRPVSALEPRLREGLERHHRATREKQKI